MNVCTPAGRRAALCARQWHFALPPKLRRAHRSYSEITPRIRHTFRSLPSLQPSRPFSQSARLSISTEEAPNAKAYLESGAISGARDLVNVSKVLVIGSGGLSIGQAGEFDYSGQRSSPILLPPKPHIADPPTYRQALKLSRPSKRQVSNPFL